MSSIGGTSLFVWTRSLLTKLQQSDLSRQKHHNSQVCFGCIQVKKKLVISFLNLSVFVVNDRIVNDDAASKWLRYLDIYGNH